MSLDIDRIDERIIYRLVENARSTSAPEIAEEVDVTDTTIRNRIDRLEENGVIRGYHADVDYERAKGFLTTLFMCTTNAEDRAKRAKELLQIPGVVNVREIMTGHGDLRVKAVGEDTEDMTRIASAITNRDIEIIDEDLIRREHHAPYQPFGPKEKPAVPSLTDFLDLRGGAEVVELTVADEAPITQCSLTEANERDILGEDVLVLTVERDENTITPRGSTQLRAGDMVRIFSQGGVPADTIEVFSNVDPDDIDRRSR
jgi:DNA-binding Lrp family transcriptional regulator